MASGIYCLALLALLKPYGNIGLIWANCLNMTVRIISSAYFIREFSKDLPESVPKLDLLSISLHRDSLIAFALGFVATQLSKQATTLQSPSLKHDAAHIAIGAVLFISVCVYMLLFKRH